MKFNSEIYEDLIGKPFREIDEEFNGKKYNCWDLVRVVYERMGIELPDVNFKCHEVLYLSHLAKEERDTLGDRVTKWDNLGEPPVPSIILFTPTGNIISHVGIYLGNGKFLHATDVIKRGICIERTYAPLWRDRIEGYYVVR